MAIDVVGLQYRRRDVVRFIEAGRRLNAEPLVFGVTARREPENRHSPKGHATAIDGWWREAGFLGGVKAHRVHLGYLPAWAAEEALDGRHPEPQIFVELYSAYLGNDDFVDIEVIVYVERTAADLEEQAREKALAEQVRSERKEERRAEREFRRSTERSLRILGRIASADGPATEVEIRAMRAFVGGRYAGAGRPLSADLLASLVADALSDDVSQSAALAAARKLADEDVEALRETMDAAFKLARSDGKEAGEEVEVIRSIVASVRRKLQP